MTDNPETTTDQKIDKVLTHPIWGLFSFIFIVWFLFYCTFTLGSYPQAWIENGMQHLIIIIKGNLQNNWIREFLCNGLVMGLGSVLAFLHK